MAQHVAIKKIDERGNLMEDCNINFAEVINVLYKQQHFQEEYPWLSTIDPYGNTIINRIQVPFVVKELRKLQEKIQNSEFSSKIKNLTNFLNTVGIHEYAKFIGD
jgi:RecA-family ATPase